jgi:hypothetical protein
MKMLKGAIMDSVQLTGNSIELQLSFFEKKISNLQKDLENLAWWNIPQSIISELGQAFDSLVDVLVEAKLAYQRHQLFKTQHALNQLAPSLDQLSHLVDIGDKLSILKPRLDKLLKYRAEQVSSLESYRRTLVRKLSVTIGMARNRYDTVGWLISELQRGIEELESHFNAHLSSVSFADSFAGNTAMAV